MTTQEQENTQYGVITLANHILDALGQQMTLEDDELLYTDEFYLQVVNSIVPPNSIDENPGTTEEEKVQKLSQLIEYLSNIVEIDLSNVSAYGIIMERDENSAKTLLELILQLIMVLKNEEDTNSQLINDDDLRVDSEFFDEHKKTGEKSSNLFDKTDHNQSKHEDNTYNQEINEINNMDNQEEDNPLERHFQQMKNVTNQQISHINNESDNNYLQNMNEEFENTENHARINKNNEENEEIEIEAQDKIINNQYQDDDRVSESNIAENSKFDIEIDKNKSCNDISNYSPGSSKLNYSLNDVSKYMTQMNIISQAQEILQKENFPTEHIEQFNSLTDKEKIKLLQQIKKKQFLSEYAVQQEFNPHMNELVKEGQAEESKSVNISRISEVRESKENSEAPSQKLLNKHASTSSKNKESVHKPQNSNNINNSINKSNSNAQNLNNSSSQMKNSYVPSKISSIESKPGIVEKKVNDEIKEDDGDKYKNINKSKISNNSKINTSNNKQNSINVSNNSKTKSKKNSTLNSKANNKVIQNQEHKIGQKYINSLDGRKDKSRSEMSMSSVKSLRSKEITHPSRPYTGQDITPDQNDQNINVEESNQSKQSYPQSDLIIEELPLNDENLKFEIMKEFKKIYGNNLHKLFLKENLNKSSNTLDLIIRNLKVAKSKMHKMGAQMQKDPDDLIVLFFI